jgi:hypothetical protein
LPVADPHKPRNGAGGAITAASITTPSNGTSAIRELPRHIVYLLKIKGAPFGAFRNFGLLKPLVFKAFRSEKIKVSGWVGI